MIWHRYLNTICRTILLLGKHSGTKKRESYPIMFPQDKIQLITIDDLLYGKQPMLCYPALLRLQLLKRHSEKKVREGLWVV
jgi:hypothetical protein